MNWEIRVAELIPPYSLQCNRIWIKRLMAVSPYPITLEVIRWVPIFRPSQPFAMHLLTE